jgi:hypothetical protein
MSWIDILRVVIIVFIKLYNNSLEYTPNNANLNNENLNYNINNDHINNNNNDNINNDYEYKFYNNSYNNSYYNFESTHNQKAKDLQFLNQQGISDYKTFTKWCIRNHPDKGGNLAFYLKINTLVSQYYAKN